MAWRSIAVVAACCLMGAADGPDVQETTASIRYVPLDAPPGASRAVVVQGVPLAHTRQLLPLDRDGKLVGPESADKQIAQVLDNLEAVLRVVGSGLDKIVRLNVYALSHATGQRTRELLAKRLAADVRPTITVVLTPLAERGALVAVDAVAVAVGRGATATFARCDTVAGDEKCADAAVVPSGGAAYLSGQPEQGGLAASAVTKSLSALFERLSQLNVKPSDVVRVKVFLTPISSADAALAEVKRFFPEGLVPPVLFVEWIASAPVEIELVARLPATGSPTETVEYYNPPDVMPSPVFSRVALVHAGRRIYIGGLSSRAPGNGEAQGRDVFDQLHAILTATGGDMRHLAKATYYVTDDEASKALDRLRPERFAPRRPPAASKVTVFGVDRAGRTLSMDMIAVGKK